jgi:hypothetical protein
MINQKSLEAVIADLKDQAIPAGILSFRLG